MKTLKLLALLSLGLVMVTGCQGGGGKDDGPSGFSNEKPQPPEDGGGAKPEGQ